MEQELIYALDIGTRSIIGVVGKAEDDKFKVVAIEREEHGKRVMLDGQIEDISQVARAARAVTGRLEERMGCSLTSVCVAAAGRALRTERGHFVLTLDGVQQINDELIGRLEAGAVSEAENALPHGEGDDQRFYLVGYTVGQYQLDHYPLSTLKNHNGHELEADIVATFLPSEVVESLYTAMREAGLDVASLTLEPIAALNAAIPQDLRLLNLVLADIGAGTTDIAVCRDGSVVGYTMATMAGDEITESLMKQFLVDFKTAERLKTELAEEGEHSFRDILGLEQSISHEELRQAVETPARMLAQEIARQVGQVNGGTPSALFLAGGGSRLAGLRETVSECMGMPLNRVAIAGGNFEMTTFAEDYDLNNPEYATPLGIAVSAGLGLISDSYRVTLNGHPAKLFRSGTLTALDVLMMNGFTYADLIGRAGANLVVTVNSQRVVYRGEPAEPALLQVNGEEVSQSTIIKAGDSMEFTPAHHGAPASRTVLEVLGDDLAEGALVNGAPATPDTRLQAGDTVVSVEPKPKPKPTHQEALQAAPPSTTAPEAASQVVPQPAPTAERCFLLNEKPLFLPQKPDGSPYYLMDLLRYSRIDFEHLERPVVLKVNGVDGLFTQALQDGDTVSITVQTE